MVAGGKGLHMDFTKNNYLELDVPKTCQNFVYDIMLDDWRCRARKQKICNEKFDAPVPRMVIG